MRVALLDCEATDKKILPKVAEPDKQTYAIEVALFILEDNELVDQYESLIRYTEEVPTEVLKLTKINPLDLKTAPHWEGVRAELVKRLEMCDRLVAHNASYDCDLLDNMPGGSMPWPKEIICTVEATEHLRGFRLGQSTLFQELFDKTVDEATLHRAAADLEILQQCYVELVHRKELH